MGFPGETSTESHDSPRHGRFRSVRSTATHHQVVRASSGPGEVDQTTPVSSGRRPVRRGRRAPPLPRLVPVPMNAYLALDQAGDLRVRRCRSPATCRQAGHSNRGTPPFAPPPALRHAPEPWRGGSAAGGPCDGRCSFQHRSRQPFHPCVQCSARNQPVGNARRSPSPHPRARPCWPPSTGVRPPGRPGRGFAEPGAVPTSTAVYGEGSSRVRHVFRRSGCAGRKCAADRKEDWTKYRRREAGEGIGERVGTGRDENAKPSAGT